MSRPVKFTVKKTSKSWCVNIPAKYSLTGKRERHFFKTKEQALAEQNKMRNNAKVFGETASAITPSLSEQATKAAELLAPYGITLIEAASRIAAIEKELAASVTIEHALDAFIAEKSKLSEKQQQAIKHISNHLRADFAGRSIAGITCDEIEAHLKTRTSGASAYAAKLRIMITLWRWCAVPKRGWCNGDLFKHAERQEVVTEEIGVLNATETRTLLTAAENHFPDMVALTAIAIFTGMRQAEIERLQPCDITSEGITVPKISAKTNKRRFIQMPEPLADWLTRYPITSELIPANYERKDKALRRIAGWKVWSDLYENKGLGDAEPPEDAPAWPQNALRHTAASLNVALGKPIETLIFEHGHAGGLQMLRQHYVGKITKADALKIWAMRPMVTAKSNEKPKNTAKKKTQKNSEKGTIKIA